MKEAVVVSTARTPIGKAYRGAFNNLEAPSFAAHAVRVAVERAGIEASEVDDCIFGVAMQQGTTGLNVARQIALRAELPVSVAGMTIDWPCASGLSPVRENGVVAAGNASQLSDGAAALVVTMCVGGGMGAAGLFEVV